MKKFISAIRSALCILPLALSAADLPWMEEMKKAATPEELKADRFISCRETDSGNWKLTVGDTELLLDRETFSMSLRRGDAAPFIFLPPGEAIVRLPDGRAGVIRLQEAGKVDVAPEAWAGVRGINLTLSDFKVDGESCDLKVHLFAGLDYANGDAVFELRPEEKLTTLRQSSWPGALDGDSVDVTVIPHMQGLLIPRSWPKVIDAPYADSGKIGMVYGRSLYMPWWGVTRGESQSALFLIETPDDAGCRIYHSPEKGTTIAPCWLHSLGRTGYTRKSRLKLIAGNYVDMAKTYRALVVENGTFRSIREKIAETPLYEKLIGSPILHVTARQYNARTGQDDLFTSYADLTRKLTRLRDEFGMKKAYVHIDGIGYRGYDNLEPDQLPVGEKAGGRDGLKKFLDFLRENGYVTVYHQQYRDMYLDAPSYDPELLVIREDGTHHIENTWAGGPNALVCAVRALDYVRRNNRYLEEIDAAPDGCYLDVFAVVPGDECYHPEHRMSRTECYKYRRQCFDYIRSHWGLVSSEEPVDWAVRTLHLTHHAPWARDSEGNTFGIPVPLFTLVYHDAIVTPFETGRKRGSYYYAATEIPFLHALISAGMPYLSEDATAEDFAAAAVAAELHGRVGMQEMVTHKLLSPDGRRQQSTYADGTVVTVDQDSGDWSVAYPDKTVHGNAISWKVE